MASQLIRSDDGFFAGFETAIGIAARMASVLRDAAASPQLPAEMPQQMRGLRAEARVVVEQLHLRMDRAFITPIEREDIHKVAMAIDDVVDTLEAAVDRLDVFGISLADEPMRWMCQAIHELVSQLVIAVRALRSFEPSVIREATERVERVAAQVDTVVDDVLRALMLPGRPAVELVRSKEVYDTLNHVAERARDVARTVRHVLVRHS